MILLYKMPAKKATVNGQVKKSILIRLALLARYGPLSIIIIASFFAYIACLTITIKFNINNDVDNNQTETKIMKEITKSNIRPLGNFDDLQEKPISNITEKTKLLLKQVDMDKSANNVTRFITYGTPRTASTLQFNVVCVCFFLHMKEHFPSLANTTNCYYQGKTNYSYTSLDQPQGKNGIVFITPCLVSGTVCYVTHLLILNSDKST